jgi:hypothetical protein
MGPCYQPIIPYAGIWIGYVGFPIARRPIAHRIRPLLPRRMMRQHCVPSSSPSLTPFDCCMIPWLLAMPRQVKGHSASVRRSIVCQVNHNPRDSMACGKSKS